ncbi:MAG: DUF92 domain-containing protein [Chloroflexota bacterium]|nr:DUF92 domain-containing protein [Chloroflexota bacterium]
MISFLTGDDVTRWVTGFVLAGLVAALAWRGRALTLDGAFAAVGVGGIIVGAGGWWLGSLLVLFFVTSSALSRLRRRGQRGVVQRGSRRDAVQVLANGGAATFATLLFALSDADAWLLGATSGVAAANADTWSTEIGRWAGRQPRLITSGRLVAAGTSGGITLPGTAAALAGAGVIGLGAALGVAMGWLALPVESVTALLVVTLAGLGGALVDSVLGATVQRVYRCPHCGQKTEQPRHRCGAATIPIQGLPGFTNDTVNALATLLAMLAGVGFGLL